MSSPLALDLKGAQIHLPFVALTRLSLKPVLNLLVSIDEVNPPGPIRSNTSRDMPLGFFIFLGRFASLGAPARICTAVSA